MNILGSLGQLYMLILLALLFLGSGLGVWAVINSSINKKDKQNTLQKKNIAGQDNSMGSQEKEKIKIGGFKMQNNGWFKLAIFSFVGILVSVAVLGLVSTNSGAADNAHLQHQQQGLQQNQNMAGMNGMNSNMQAQGGMNTGMPVGNMPMQGNVNSNMQMQGGMNTGMPVGNMQNQGNMQIDNNYMMIQQQLNQMQQQIYMMQQQMMNNASMQPSSGGGSMPAGGSSGGGMGMM